MIVQSLHLCKHTSARGSSYANITVMQNYSSAFGDVAEPRGRMRIKTQRRVFVTICKLAGEWLVYESCMNERTEFVQLDVNRSPLNTNKTSGADCQSH